MGNVSKIFRKLVVCLFAGSIAAMSGVALGADSNSPPGTILWEFRVASTAPAVGPDGTIYITSSEHPYGLYALTPAGAKKWEAELGGGFGAPAVAQDGTIYVSGNMMFRAFNTNGTLRWTHPFPDYRWFYNVSPPAIAHDGTIYVGTGNPDKGLYAFEPDGDVKWKFSASGDFAEVYAPVIGKDGTIYFGSYNDGAYAVNPDGTRRWYVPMQGYNISCAIGGDGTVYVVGSIAPNKLFAFTPEGVKKWEAEIGPEYSQAASPPVIGADGTIFVRSDTDWRIYAFNPDGSTKWLFRTNGNVGGWGFSPAIDSQGNLYSTLGDAFYALSPTGSVLWSLPGKAGLAPILTSDGILYLTAAPGYLYAIRANAGLGNDPWPMFQRDPRHTGAAPPGAVTKLPVLSVAAAIRFASEGGTDRGRFTITRIGGSSNALSVGYVLSGTASNGVDYVRLSGTALFDAGVRSTDVLVTALRDSLVEDEETVVLTLTPHSTYHVGMSNTAVVTIHDSHIRPTVTMLTSANKVIPAETNFLLSADASSGDAPIAKVEFFEGERSLGIAERPLPAPDGLYSLTWSNVPAGLYEIRAKATDDAGAYAFSEPISLIALAPTNISPPGTILWQFPAGAVYSPPAVGADGTVYVVGGHPNYKLYALTPTGAKKWERGHDNPFGSPAIAADGTVYVAAERNFRAYTADGELVWASSMSGGASSPAISRDGTIYVNTRGSLRALTPQGSFKWEFSPPVAFPEVYAPVIGGDGTVYFGSYRDGFYALNPDGSRRWYYPMQGYRISAAIGADGTVYVVGSIFPSKLYAFTPGGVKKWETQIGPEFSQAPSPPVIDSDGTIFVSNDSDLKIYAFDSNGSTKWSFASGGNIGGASTSPAVDSQGNVYSGSGPGFFAVSTTGSRLWSYRTNGGFAASALTRDGILYVGNAAGSFYAFRANAGLGNDPWPMFQRDLRRTGAAPSVDADGDGVPNGRDVCPDTASGAVVNAQGCSIAQLCLCDGNSRNHGEYVRCVIDHAGDFHRAGLIDAAERKAIVAEAARADCGRPARSREPVLLHLSRQTRENSQREGMRVIVAGEVGGHCIVEVSNDLIHWKPLEGEALVGEEFALPVSSGVKATFYRVRLGP
jgi:outer membrane protein assembly factor BamB